MHLLCRFGGWKRGFYQKQAKWYQNIGWIDWLLMYIYMYVYMYVFHIVTLVQGLASTIKYRDEGVCGDLLVLYGSKTLHIWKMKYIRLAYLHADTFTYILSCIRQSSARGPVRKNCFDEGVCGCLQVLYRFGCQKGGFSMPKIEQKRYQKQPEWNRKGAKMSRGTFGNTPLGIGTDKFRKRGRPWLWFGDHFG